MDKKLYEFKKGFMNHKTGETMSLTIEEASLLKDYVVEHISKEQRLKNLKEATINKLKEVIFLLETNKYGQLIKLLDDWQNDDGVIEYIDFNHILTKSLGQTIFFESGDIGTVIRILAGGV